MRLATDDEPIDVPLTHITFRAETFDACSGARVNLDAVIPVAAGDIVLPTDKGPRSIEELAGTAQGPMGGGEDGWMLRAKFDAEATSFDFGSAP